MAEIIPLNTNFTPCIVEVRNNQSDQEVLIATLQDVNAAIDMELAQLRRQIKRLTERRDLNTHVIEEFTCQTY